MQTLTETISRTVSNQLGQLYHGGQVPDGLHELLHGANAYTIEKFRTGDSKKARSAAAGAIAAEVSGKIYLTADVFKDPNATPEQLQKAIDRGVQLAELAAASVATLMKLDADAAVSAATIAAQENALSQVHYQKAVEAQQEALQSVDQQDESLQALIGEGYVPTPEEVQAALGAFQKLKADLGVLGIKVTTPAELSMLESGEAKAVGVPEMLAISKGAGLLLRAASQVEKLKQGQTVELRKIYKTFVRDTKDFVTQCKTYKFRNRDWHKELGIPKHWERLPTKKPGGVKFRNPAKPKYDEIRIMAGKPKSEFPGQKVAYIKVMKDGKFYDVSGKLINGKGKNLPESHIALEKLPLNLVRDLWKN